MKNRNIQDNFNNVLIYFAVASAVDAAAKNKKKKQSDSLDDSIEMLKTEIAISKDKNESTTEKERLLKERLELKNSYIKAETEREDRQRKTGIAIGIIMAVVIIGFSIAMLAICL